MMRRPSLVALVVTILLVLLAPATAFASGWEAPATLKGGSGEALGTAVAAGPSGTAFAAWEEIDGGGFAVYAARYANGAWGAAQRISDAPLDDVTIRLGADRAGGAVAVWRSAKGIQAARFTGGAWLAPVVLAGPAAQGARVAVGVRGTATVAWSESDGAGSETVRVARLENGAWSAPTGVSASGAISSVGVTAGRPGEAVVGWVRQVGKLGVVEVARFDGTAWGAPETWSNPADDASSLQLSGAADGEANAVWRSLPSDDAGIDVVSRRLANGELRPVRTLAAYPGGASIPQLVVNEAIGSRAAVAWTIDEGTTSRIEVRLRLPDGWVAGPAIAGADSPQLVMAPDGVATLVYRVPVAGHDRVMAVRARDNAWGAPAQLGTTGASAGPRIALGAYGTPTVTWTELVGKGDVARAVRYRVGASSTPHLDAVAQSIRAMEVRTGSDSSEGLLWQVTDGNALDGAGTAAPDWLIRSQDCWGRTDPCSSEVAQQHMLTTIRGIIGGAETVADVSSLAFIADGGFRQALIDGARDADLAGRRPVIRLLWGRMPAELFANRKLRAIQKEIQAAAPHLKVVAALMSRTLVLNGYSWNHSKIVAADGKVAWAAGINLWARSYLQSDNPVTDVGAVVRGPAALDATGFLDLLWNDTCRHEHSFGYSITIVPSGGGAGGCPSKLAPASSPAVGDVRVLAVGRAGWIDTGRVVGSIPIKEVSNADRRDSGCMIPPLPNPMNGNPKWDGNNPSDTALRALVATAKSRIVISQQDAIFACAVDPSYDVRLFDALAERLRAGVDVTIVVSNAKTNVTSLQNYSGSPAVTQDVLRKRLTRLTGSASEAKAILCRSLTIAPLRVSDAATWPNGKAQALHGKVIAVDDAAFYVGSQNAYPNELQEFGWIIEDPAAMGDFRRDYLDPLVRYSSKAAIPCG